MCEKQCRDENGFKCHTMSEGHLRQMRVFAENPNAVLDDFSKEFERGYLQTLSHLHGTKRILANRVYQEYIADKHHIHMNATIWTTLTGFCKYLGKEGKAIVDETEKGWFIQYVERDPKILERQAQNEQRKQLEMDEEERNQKIIEEQIRKAEEKQRQREEAKAMSTEAVDSKGKQSADESSSLPSAPSAPIKVALSMTAKSKTKRPVETMFGDEDDNDDDNGHGHGNSGRLSVKKPKSAMEQIIMEESHRK